MPKADLQRRIDAQRAFARELADRIKEGALRFPPGERPDTDPPGIPSGLAITYSVQDYVTYESLVQARWTRNLESDCKGYITRYCRVPTAPAAWAEHEDSEQLGAVTRAKLAVQFTAKGGEVDGVLLILKLTGNPGGQIRVAIYDDDGSADHLPNTQVTHGASDWVDVTDVDTEIEVWEEFTFSTSPTLTSNATYHVILESGVGYLYTVADHIKWYYSSHLSNSSAENYYSGTWYNTVRERLTFLVYGDSGSGTGTENLFTDSNANWLRNGFVNHRLIDSDGTEFTISASTATTLTVSGTPASGTYTILSPWIETWISQPDTGTYAYAQLGNIQGGYHQFQVSSEDIWHNRSTWCTAVEEWIPGPGVYGEGSSWPQNTSAPTSLTTDFTGKDCEVWWEAPTDMRPEWDFKIEIRDSAAGALLQEYYRSATQFTFTFEENSRIHSPSDPSPTLHISVYTRNPSGFLSAAATDTATNAVPSAPSSITYNFAGKDCIIFVDVGTETDILDVEYDVAAA